MALTGHPHQSAKSFDEAMPPLYTAHPNHPEFLLAQLEDFQENLVLLFEHAIEVDPHEDQAMNKHEGGIMQISANTCSILFLLQWESVQGTCTHLTEGRD